MLANFLEKSKPINFVVYVVLFFTFFLIEVFKAFFSTSFLFENVFKSISFLGLFLLVFFFFNFIIKKNKLTFDNTFGYFLFTIFIVGFIKNLLDYKSLFTLLLYFLFLRKTYSLRTNVKMLQKLFDAGFWLGVLVVFQPNYIVMLLLIYTAVFVYRVINVQTILIPVIGVFVPIFLSFSYLFYFDKTDLIFQKLNENIFSFKLDYSIENSWFLVFISLLTLFSFILKTPKIAGISNKFRKSWILININYLVIFVLILIGNSLKEVANVCLLFPASIIIANGIELIVKKRFQSVVFAVIIFITFFGWVSF